MNKDIVRRLGFGIEIDKIEQGLCQKCQDNVFGGEE